MQTEIEAKFLNIDLDEIREKLKAAGAKLEHPMSLMRRKNFDFNDLSLEKIGGWVRLRDEGDKITLAYKQLNHRGLDGTKEVSVEVSDFDETSLLLEQIGLEQKSYQETKRESWTIQGVQVELDEWPWVKPFIEIEAPNETLLYDIADILGVNRADALHGSVEIVYQQEYDVTDAEVDHWKAITFEAVPVEVESKRKKR